MGSVPMLFGTGRWEISRQVCVPGHVPIAFGLIEGGWRVYTDVRLQVTWAYVFM